MSCFATMAYMITPCLGLKLAANLERTFMLDKMEPDHIFSLMNSWPSSLQTQVMKKWWTSMCFVRRWIKKKACVCREFSFRANSESLQRTKLMWQGAWVTSPDRSWDEQSVPPLEEESFKITLFILYIFIFNFLKIICNLCIQKQPVCEVCVCYRHAKANKTARPEK